MADEYLLSVRNYYASRRGRMIRIVKRANPPTEIYVPYTTLQNIVHRHKEKALEKIRAGKERAVRKPR